MKSILTKLYAIFTVCCLSAADLRTESPDMDFAGYLFVYFTGNEKEREAVHFALSADGFNYRSLNGNRPVLDSRKISSTGGVRDPHILRREEGGFYMVSTDMVSSEGWDSNRGMVLLRSDDLINWTSNVVNIQMKYPGQDSLLRVWAPQTIRDSETGKYMIYWSMKYGSGPDIIYYAYANDAFTDLEGEPRVLFRPRSGYSCIDGDIVEKDGLYHLFYKTEGHGNGIKMATRRSLTSGVWEEREVYKQQTSDPAEGSCVFKLTGTDTYILMYDLYTKGRYEFCTSTDLDDFIPIRKTPRMDFRPRHGTVIPITRREMNALLAQWGSELRMQQSEDDPEQTSIYPSCKQNDNEETRDF